MNPALWLGLILLLGSLWLLRRGLRQAASEKVVQRLVTEQPQAGRVSMSRLQRELLRSGLQLPGWMVVLMLGLWLLIVLLGWLTGGWLALLVLLPLPPLKIGRAHV